MSEKDKMPTWAVVSCLSGMFFLGVAFGLAINSNSWRADAIDRGFAEYHQQTGAWQWKTNVWRVE